MQKYEKTVIYALLCIENHKIQFILGTIYLLSPIVLLNKYTHKYAKLSSLFRLDNLFCIYFLLPLLTIIHTLYV